MIKVLSFLRNTFSSDVDRHLYAAKMFGDFLTGDYRVSMSTSTSRATAEVPKPPVRLGRLTAFGR
jgi:hypothetical protein